jgi:Ca2+-binding RTX toxin-like protein
VLAPLLAAAVSLQGTPDMPAVGYRAASGQANRVTIARVDDRTIRVADSGATIVPGAGCRTLDSHTALCTAAAPLGDVRVEAADGDDVVTAEGARLDADGGPGDDRIAGGARRDRLDGGAGHDRLDGGPGADTLFARRDGADDVGCGAGLFDEVVDPNRRDVIHAGCEYASFGHLVSLQVRPRPLRLDARSVVFRVFCPEDFAMDGSPVAISGVITLQQSRGRHHGLGHGRIPTAAGRGCADFEHSTPFEVPVALNAHGRRLLSRPHGALAVVRLRSPDTADASWTTRVRIPR